MSFQKLKFNEIPENEMLNRSANLLNALKTRRSVRDFSSRPVSEEIIHNCIKTAVYAPSGANKQPWHFMIVKDPGIKKEIRTAAEAEEKEFYSHRATKEWLEDLNQFGTDWHKPFLETAPYLIVIFKEIIDKHGDESRKNYYVNESVGIAAGFLLTAIHNAGLASLTHTPSPMKFLQEILNRPENERAFLLIPVGYPADEAEVPVIDKKPFDEVCETV
ncbi:MAG: nitroreductase family protein [Candidatus Marinimicrobia bacterium]|jgi:nitroreductase|nr:nitroreductase family protein [Candidatus Neomarinimicrobiota bacterium]MDP6726523.1 nitroreductase family protein [Candidatus Neomarinimicrobiota bacterium]|tara:strand:+ start:47801 stop:48454 length:654 start_codon:yes stop_codon:yes gene_type:complete